MPVVLLPIIAFVVIAAVPAVGAVRRAPRAAVVPRGAIPLQTGDVTELRRMMVVAYEEERTAMHHHVVQWLGSLGRGPLRVTDAQACGRTMGCDTVTLVDGTVLSLSTSGGHAVRDVMHALDRFVEVALTRVRAARDGFELTFDIEGREVNASAELLTVRGAWV